MPETFPSLSFSSIKWAGSFPLCFSGILGHVPVSVHHCDRTPETISLKEKGLWWLMVLEDMVLTGLAPWLGLAGGQWDSPRFLSFSVG